ncbi:MAG TPA: type II toxin-antitoxin system RelE/ParE family toxin [Alphaproteobacteria bacterium]|jgi:proteic killer suppression protein
MIRSFGDRRAAAFFRGERVASFQPFADTAARRLQVLNDAASLNDLARVPGNRLEALRGDRSGQYSIRINRQWRICFEFQDGDAHNVEIVDYH